MPKSLPIPHTEDRRILVVEDEPFLRIALCEDLRAAGLSVIEAASADEALECLQAGLAVEVVFSDIQMPGTLDGIGLARQLGRTRPDIRVILTSGNSGPPDDLEGIRFVPKPYEHGTVSDLLFQALDLKPRQDT